MRALDFILVCGQARALCVRSAGILDLQAAMSIVHRTYFPCSCHVVAALGRGDCPFFFFLLDRFTWLSITGWINIYFACRSRFPHRQTHDPRNAMLLIWWGPFWGDWPQTIPNFCRFLFFLLLNRERIVPSGINLEHKIWGALPSPSNASECKGVT